jgi:hypothetical protein
MALTPSQTPSRCRPVQQRHPEVTADGNRSYGVMIKRGLIKRGVAAHPACGNIARSSAQADFAAMTVARLHHFQSQGRRVWIA